MMFQEIKLEKIYLLKIMKFSIMLGRLNYDKGILDLLTAFKN